MYWSVVGLYCAFCAEVLTRAPRLFRSSRQLGIVFSPGRSKYFYCDVNRHPSFKKTQTQVEESILCLDFN